MLLYAPSVTEVAKRQATSVRRTESSSLSISIVSQYPCSNAAAVSGRVIPLGGFNMEYAIAIATSLMRLE